MTSETLHKVSHLCEVDQTAQPSDVFIASTSPVTTKGHTVNALINGVAPSLLVDTGSAITLIGGIFGSSVNRTMTHWNLGQNG